MNRADFDRIHRARRKVWEHWGAHPEQLAALRARRRRPPARPPSLWTKARQFCRKAASLVKALTGPRTSPEVRAVRWATCEPCSMRVVRDGKSYCGACFCPKWKPAELQVKVRLSLATCPLKKWPRVFPGPDSTTDRTSVDGASGQPEALTN